MASANGSSIAVIAEYAGRRLALLGDAHAPTLAATLGRMAAATGAATLRLDAVKLAHHGSAANLSPDLLGRIECGPRPDDPLLAGKQTFWESNGLITRRVQIA